MTWAGAGAIVALALLAATAGQGTIVRHSSAVVFGDTRCGAARTADLSIDVRNGRVRLNAFCIDDRPHGSADRRILTAMRPPVRLPDGALLSLAAPGVRARYPVQIRDSVDGIELVARRPDGAPCVDLRLDRIARAPVPARFLPTNGDWRETIEYQIDPACRMIAIRAGNRMVLVPLGSPRSFAFGRLHVGIE